MGANFWSSPSGDLSCHFDPSPFERGLHHHVEVAGRRCGWFPFLCNTATNHLEVLHRAACRVITGCLSSTSSSLLLLEAQLPPLKLTLEHQALFLLRTCSASPPPPRLLQPLCLGNKKRSQSTKEETLLEIILFFGYSIPPIPMRDSDHVFPFSPMDCNPRYRFPFHSRLHRQQYSSTPVCFKQTILPPPSDIQVWTDGSVPSLFGPGGAGVYVTCSKCNTSNSLSFSIGPIASRFTAEIFAFKQGLDWCTCHLMTCKFQSILFLTDSQSALSILSSALSYLLPESLWNVWSLASSLSNNTTLCFQWAELGTRGGVLEDVLEDRF